MIRLIIEIQRTDRPPWQRITTGFETEGDDLSERLTANRFARIAWELLKQMHDEANTQTSPKAPTRGIGCNPRFVVCDARSLSSTTVSG
jgi:hypothetical protein